MATKRHTKQARAIAEAHERLVAAQAALEAAEGALEDAQGVPVTGRPTKFKQEFIVRVTDLCMLGFTNEDLAAHFAVDIRVLDSWIASVPAFRRAIWLGREGADAAVTRALFKSATGYEHVEDDIRVVALGQGMGSEIVITPTTKRYAPSDRASELWLRNRQRTRWSALNSGSQQTSAAEQAQAARAAIAAAMSELDEEQPPTDGASLS